MSIDLRNLTDLERNKIARAAAGALHETPWSRIELWPHVVLVLEEGQPMRAVAAGTLVGEFRANGLHTLARDVLNRRLKRGQVMIYVCLETADMAGAQVVTFDLGVALLWLASSNAA